MPTTSLMPLPKQQYLTALGTPLFGGKVYTYAAGTTTPKATYTDSAGTEKQPNPIPLDLRGEPSSPIFWSGNYRVDVRDRLGNLIYTVDNYNTDPAGVWEIAAGFLGGVGASLIGFIQDGAGAIARTVQDELRDVVKVSQFSTFQQAVDRAAASKKALYLDKDVTLAALSIIDFSAGSGMLITGPGRIIGPAVAEQGQPSAYFKIWGSIGTPVSYPSTIAEGANTFPISQGFAFDDMTMLSNFPTHATDAYTEGGPDIFGGRARTYANFSPANLRQTRRKEILVVASSSIGTFSTTSGAVHNYGSTDGLQFQKITPVRGLRFVGIGFENIYIDMRYTRDVSFEGCTGLSTTLTGQSCLNTVIDFKLFDARRTDCRVDFYEKCHGVQFAGTYKNIRSPSDNAVLKFLGCDDVNGTAIIEGCKNSNGFMIDTAFTENPSGYSDLPSLKGAATIDARFCEGAGAAFTCDPYAAEVSGWVLHYTGDDTGVLIKGGRNIDVYANISSSDSSNNSMFFLGASDINVYGRQRGGIYSAPIQNPRDASQTRDTIAITRIGAQSLLANQPAFCSYLTTITGTTGDGIEITIPFDSELFDKNNNHAFGTFTAPVDGTYLISATLKLNGVSSSHTSGNLVIQAAGTRFPVAISPFATVDAAGSCGVTLTTLAKMTGGSIAQVKLTVNGSAKTVQVQGSGAIESYWSATLMN